MTPNGQPESLERIVQASDGEVDDPLCAVFQSICTELDVPFARLADWSQYDTAIHCGQSISEFPAVWDDLEFPSTFADVDAETRVGYKALDRRFGLGAIEAALGFEHVSYEPAKCPALVYRPEETETGVLLWQSGVVMGAGESYSEIVSEIEHLIDQIRTKRIVHEQQVPDTVYVREAGDLLSA